MIHLMKILKQRTKNDDTRYDDMQCAICMDTFEVSKPTNFLIQDNIIRCCPICFAEEIHESNLSNSLTPHLLDPSTLEAKEKSNFKRIFTELKISSLAEEIFSDNFKLNNEQKEKLKTELAMDGDVKKVMERVDSILQAFVRMITAISELEGEEELMIQSSRIRARTFFDELAMLRDYTNGTVAIDGDEFIESMGVQGIIKHAKFTKKALTNLNIKDVHDFRARLTNTVEYSENVLWSAFEDDQMKKLEENQADMLFSSNVVRCPRCFQGPVVFLNCSDLSAHYGDPQEGGFGNPRHYHTDSRCSSCLFYTVSKQDWIGFASDKDPYKALPVLKTGLWHPLTCKNEKNCYDINEINWRNKLGMIPPRYPCEPWKGGDVEDADVGCNVKDIVKIRNEKDLSNFLAFNKLPKQKEMSKEELEKLKEEQELQELLTELLPTQNLVENGYPTSYLLDTIKTIKQSYPRWKTNVMQKGQLLSEVLEQFQPFNSEIYIIFDLPPSDKSVKVMVTSYEYGWEILPGNAKWLDAENPTAVFSKCRVLVPFLSFELPSGMKISKFDVMKAKYEKKGAGYSIFPNSENMDIIVNFEID